MQNHSFNPVCWLRVDENPPRRLLNGEREQAKKKCVREKKINLNVIMEIVLIWEGVSPFAGTKKKYNNTQTNELQNSCLNQSTK